MPLRMLLFRLISSFLEFSKKVVPADTDCRHKALSWATSSQVFGLMLQSWRFFFTVSLYLNLGLPTFLSFFHLSVPRITSFSGVGYHPFLSSVLANAVGFSLTCTQCLLFEPSLALLCLLLYLAIWLTRYYVRIADGIALVCVLGSGNRSRCLRRTAAWIKHMFDIPQF